MLLLQPISFSVYICSMKFFLSFCKPYFLSSCKIIFWSQIKKCAVKTLVVVKINPLCHLFFCIFITEVWSLTDMFCFQS